MAAGWGRMLLVMKKPLLLVSPIWKGLDLELSPFARPPCDRCPMTEFPDEDGTTTLLPCVICNRTFNPKALERHSKVCEKLSTKKRKAFNSTKQRQEGTDIGSVPLVSLNKPIPKPKSRWREKHREFLRAIRAAKGLEVDEGDEYHGSSGSTVPSDYIQCQYCQRHFGPKAADRHISWCREQRSRLPRSPAPSAATERLKSRTKYVPPKPGQNGWRAPKKRDVISSIPPPNTSTGSHPALSAPPVLVPPNVQRRTSPPPGGPPSRRTSSSTLGLSNSRSSGTMSLGRSAGKQFASMLQSVTGQSSGYGVSSGYGTSSGYGSTTPSRNRTPSMSNPSPSPLLPRSGSLRGSSQRKSARARQRDLASDMLASVCLGGKATRGEPEGIESLSSSPPLCSEESYSRKEEKEIVNQRKKITETNGYTEFINREVQESRWHDGVQNSNHAVAASLNKLIAPISCDLESRNKLDHRTCRDNTLTESDYEKSAKEKKDRTYSKIERTSNIVNTENSEIVQSTLILGASVTNTEVDHGGGESSNTVSDHEVLLALQDNYESDEDLDIPVEEHYLKSSTSTDEDLLGMTSNRPRSVHFEDEKGKQDKCEDERDAVHDEQLTMAFHISGGSSNHTRLKQAHQNCVSIQTQHSKSGWEESTHDLVNENNEEAHQAGIPFSGRDRLRNVKSAGNGSVRELFRRRRKENGDAMESDTRKRIIRISPDHQENNYGGITNDFKMSNSNLKSDSQKRSSSRSRNEVIHREITSLNMKKSSSTPDTSSFPQEWKKRDCLGGRVPAATETYAGDIQAPVRQRRGSSFQKEKRSLLPKPEKQFENMTHMDDGGVIITKRDYVLFKALVDSKFGLTELRRNNVESCNMRTFAGNGSSESKRGARRVSETGVTLEPNSSMVLRNKSEGKIRKKRQQNTKNSKTVTSLSGITGR